MFLSVVVEESGVEYVIPETSYVKGKSEGDIRNKRYND